MTKPSNPHSSRSTLSQQFAVLTAPVAVHAVVRAHHRGDALVDDALELGQVHLVEGHLVDGDVDRNRAFSIELQAKCFTQAMACVCTPRVSAAPISPTWWGSSP